MLDYALARRTLVDSQLRTFDVNDLDVLAAFEAVPRELFVPAGRESLAYSDALLTVSEGVVGAERRQMLAPAVLARIVQQLALRAGERVLDVACGLGYGTAVMTRLGVLVTGLESTPAMAEAARARLAAAGVDAAVAAGALELGHADGAPYDAILVNGAVEKRPDGLLAQLAEQGRLICVAGAAPTGAAPVGVVTLHLRKDGTGGSRALFDAFAPVLPAFRREPTFTF